MTLDAPWSTFDLPDTGFVSSAGPGLVLQYPDTSAAVFDRALRDAGWERLERTSGAVQVTSTWARDGWRVLVNQSGSRRTQVLDVRLSIVGVPETERWGALALPIGPGVIVRDNERELTIAYDLDPTVALDAELGRLRDDGWVEGRTQSARTLVTRADQPALTVWAEPGGAQTLVHLAWGGPVAASASPPLPALPPIAQVDGPRGPVDALPRAPLVAPWTTLDLPVGEGVVVFADASTVAVIYAPQDLGAVFAPYETAVQGHGYLPTYTSKERELWLAAYTRGGDTLTLAVMRSGDYVVVALARA